MLKGLVVNTECENKNKNWKESKCITGHIVFFIDNMIMSLKIGHMKNPVHEGKRRWLTYQKYTSYFDGLIIIDIYLITQLSSATNN